MAEHGFNGRELKILRNGIAFAQVKTKSVPHVRESVDVTTDDDDGWRRLLPAPGRRALDVQVEGVANPVGLEFMLNDWLLDAFSDIQIHYPNGAVATCEDGFVLSALEWSGDEKAHVAFKATLQSSGPVQVIGGS